MSQTAALTAAVGSLTTAVNNAVAQEANFTPDADVTTAVTALNSLTSQLTTAFPAPPSPSTPAA